MKHTPLKRLLFERGIKQEWLAQQTGLPANTISRIVNGRSEPTLRTARAIARVLGVSIEELWPEDGESHEG